MTLSQDPPRTPDFWLRAEREADGWSGTSPTYPPGPGGLLYRCHHCGREYVNPSGARKHEHLSGHTVLRVDWLADGYLELLKRPVVTQLENQR